MMHMQTGNPIQAGENPKSWLLISDETPRLPIDMNASVVTSGLRAAARTLKISAPEVGETVALSAITANVIVFDFDREDATVFGSDRLLVVRFADGALLNIGNVNPIFTKLLWAQTGEEELALNYFPDYQLDESTRFDRFDPSQGIGGLQAVGGLVPTSLRAGLVDNGFAARKLVDELDNPLGAILPPLFTPNDDNVNFANVFAGTYLDGTQYDALDGDDVVVLPVNAAIAAQAGYDPTHDFHGNGGNDFIVSGGFDDKIFGDDGNDVIQSGDGADTIDGGEGSDSLMGQSGADALSGGAGADFLFGGDEADIIDGGDDDDAIFGEGGDDTLSGDDGNDSIEGSIGNDKISGGLGADILHGNEGKDTIQGDTGDDSIFGGEGDDTLHGNDGKDYIVGGNGDDDLWGNNGNDTLLGGAGTDGLSGGNGDDELQGGDDLDLLMGDAGADHLFGQGGNDILFGGDGDDQIVGDGPGENGDDVINGDAGNDLIDAGLGDDTVSGGDGADTISGREGSDALNGDAGNDVIHGEAGDDSILGGTGDDYLVGDAGMDIIEGGAGVDTLFGGAEADVFAFKAGDGGDTIDLADTISDFQDGMDLLKIAGFDINNLKLEQNGADTAIIYNNEYLAVLKNVAVADVTAADFAP